MAEGVEVSLDEDHCHDLAAMSDAIRPDTTVVWVCNPNNPTGTHVPAEAVAEFVASVPERVLVVIDEAYWEFADERAPGLTANVSFRDQEWRSVLPALAMCS